LALGANSLGWDKAWQAWSPPWTGLINTESMKKQKQDSQSMVSPFDYLT